MTEAELLAAILELAAARGWRTMHQRPAMTERGWRTAVQGDGVGFPDLVLAGRQRVEFWELKGNRGRLTLEQEWWRDALSGNVGYTWRCVRPDDWTSGRVEEWLA